MCRLWTGDGAVAANVLTGAALLSPAEATTLTVYSVPGTRELKPDCVAAEPISLVLRWVPDVRSFRITSYQSTYPAERGQKTRSAVEPLRTRAGSNSTRSAVGPTGSVRADMLLLSPPPLGITVRWYRVPGCRCLR